MRLAMLGRNLLPAVLVLLVSCEGGYSSDIDDQRVITITVIPPTPTITVEGTVQLEATARDVNSDIVSTATFVWSSFNEPVAMVDGNGLVTGLAVGQAIVDARIVGVPVTAGSSSVNVVAAAAAPARDR